MFEINFCSHCGYRLPSETPAVCERCEFYSYEHVKTSVTVLLVTPNNKFIVGRRAPGKSMAGEYVHLGGLIESGRHWMDVAVSEVYEESSGLIQIPLGQLKFQSVRQSNDNKQIVLCTVCELREVPNLSQFKPNKEIDELKVLDGYQPLAYDIHSEMLEQFLAERKIRPMVAMFALGEALG